MPGADFGPGIHGKETRGPSFAEKMVDNLKEPYQKLASRPKLIVESGVRIFLTLYEAASNGDEARVQGLLDKGADIECRGVSSKTPLMVAAANGHGAVVRLLLEMGADVTDRDRSGRTALSRAAEEGHEAVVKLLAKKKGRRR